MLDAIREAGYFLTRRKTETERRATALRSKWKDPKEPRHWHRPSDSVQAARIEAAAAKREWRAKLAQLNAKFSRHYNEAHKHSRDFDSLNPFYIAK